MVLLVESTRLKHAIVYTFGRYQIRINFWYLIIFLIVQTLLNELGFWQLSRAKAKQTRIVQLEKGSQSILTSLENISTEQIEQFQSVELDLELVGYNSFLLDNKISNKRPGYHVLNVATDPLSGKYLLVNRGWIFAGADRNKLPQVDLPGANWQVSARIYPIAQEAISTASAEIEESRDLSRLPVLDLKVLAQIEEKLDLKLEPYLLRLNEGSSAAYETNWVWTNMSPQKHLAYAIQWFALALAFLIVSLVVCIKKR